MNGLLFLVLLLAVSSGSAAARESSHAASHETSRGSSSPGIRLTPAAIEAASPSEAAVKGAALIVKAEVLLDRDHFSPGEIDGKDSANFRKAVRAFQQFKGLPDTGMIDAETWSALTGDAAKPVLMSYTISPSDVAGPFARRIPAGLEALAKLPGLSYTSPRQELAEKFHMSQALLSRLNPTAQWNRVGTTIIVTNVAPMRLRNARETVEAAPPPTRAGQSGEAATVRVNKAAREVRAYDRDGKLVGVYPATIGSAEKPAPTGTFAVRAVAWNPDYHYDPKFAWKGVKAAHKLTVKKGPNNPVGLVWIDLTAPTYGIHGTPQPAKIGGAESHGCIRLTNWDAAQLATMVHRGTAVSFDDQDSPVVPPPGASADQR